MKRLVKAPVVKVQTESAVAGLLGITLGGKVSYFGKYYEKPTIGIKRKELEIHDITITHKIMFLTSLLFFIALILVLWCINIWI